MGLPKERSRSGEQPVGRSEVVGAPSRPRCDTTPGGHCAPPPSMGISSELIAEIQGEAGSLWHLGYSNEVGAVEDLVGRLSESGG